MLSAFTGAPRSNVWLASYPKSGNTWFRLVWGRAESLAKGLDSHSEGALIPQSAPQSGDLTILLGLGLDLREMTTSEFMSVWSAIESEGSAADPPLLRKTHEVFRTLPNGAELFPVSSSRGAVVLMRDPRDLVISYARHFGMTIDAAVDMVCGGGVDSVTRPVYLRQGPQRAGWGYHLTSWLDQDCLPIHPLRYEDLLESPYSSFMEAFDFAGVAFSENDVRQGIDECHIERLREEEQRRGFPERIGNEPFFGQGSAGVWRKTLTNRHVNRIEEALGHVMTRVGYSLSGSSP